ncbi:MAG: phosphomannose isomerase type II C-terminal cupin domain [Candidatus Saccharicenans sp.]|nr:phosphomannose isomerase type II C-terminal cupin domain [Candidatus Saccharicenans sp.]
MAEIPDREKVRELIYEEHRPWGKFRSYPHRLASSLKIITVNPGGILSLQYHRKRSEYWVVLDSGLEITVGEKVWQPEPGEEIYIPAETPHRLKAVGQQPARVMELWLGESDENDIVRLEDVYGRD